VNLLPWIEILNVINFVHVHYHVVEVVDEDFEFVVHMHLIVDELFQEILL
jgi:hypothetical protein